MSLLGRLTGGTRNSIGAAEQVAEDVLAGRGDADELYAGLHVDDAVVCGRAAHALMQVAMRRPDLVQPYKQRLIAHMAPSDQWEVRQQFVKIMGALDLAAEDVPVLLGIYETYLQAPQSLVRTYALQGLVDLLPTAPELKADITTLVALSTQGGTAAVRARARKLLKQLEKPPRR